MWHPIIAGCTYIFATCAALNLLLNLVGIHLYGALGAAIATTVAVTVRNLWVHHHVVKKTGFRPSILAAFSSQQRSEA